MYIDLYLIYHSMILQIVTKNCKFCLGLRFKKSGTPMISKK